eukprot:5818969-Prorocentrum_lima.AAC.1
MVGKASGGASSRTLKLDFLANSEGEPDGLVGSHFHWVIGDQCQLRQRDRETGELFSGRTFW